MLETAEYQKWLLDGTREQLDFVLLDLIRLSQNQRVICDCHLAVEQAKRFSDPSRVAFLIREPVNYGNGTDRLYVKQLDH